MKVNRGRTRPGLTLPVARGASSSSQRQAVTVWRGSACMTDDLTLGRSSDQVPVATLVRFNRAKVLYAAKHFGRGTGEWLRLQLLGAIAWEWCVEAAKLVLGHKPQLRRDRLRAYRSVLDSGLRRLP
jgi:hypothetical protein